MIIDKINSLSNLTVQEQAVVDYINKNPRSIIELGITELSSASYTSTSTVIRLCKKIGLYGYSKLKYIYASEFNEMMERNKKVKKQPFNGSETIDDVLDLIPMVYKKSIDYMRSLLNRDDIIRTINLVNQSERIEIYANGFNYELGKQLAYRFEGVYKDCFVYNTPHWDHIGYLPLSNKKTIAILISSTGLNPVIVDAATRLKKQGVKLIAITKKDSLLAQMCDFNFYILEVKSELELQYPIQSIAVQYFCDVCTSSLLIQQYPTVVKVIDKIRHE